MPRYPKPANKAAERSPPTTGPYGPSGHYTPWDIASTLAIVCPTCAAPVNYGCRTAAGYLTLHLPRLDAGRKAAKQEA